MNQTAETPEKLDESDKRVKECDYCGKLWRDTSLRNTRKTCSVECRRGIKTLQRRRQREREALLNPKPRKRRIKDDYAYWNEYPYWMNEKSRRDWNWKHEVPYSSDYTEQIIAAKQRYDLMGGRKKETSFVPYSGNEDEEIQPRISVLFPDSDRSSGEVVSYTMEPDKIEEYLRNKYGKF